MRSFMNVQTPSDEKLVECTRRWIESVIIACDFCPFAGREFARNSIHYRVIRTAGIEHCLELLIEECVLLDAEADVETSLLLFPDGFGDFDDFLDLVGIADALLADQGYEGVYQLASFHPDYCFADQDGNDPANYTNRSPYPTLHLLREASLERVLGDHPDPDLIPQRNIAFARRQGLEKMRALLAACIRPDGPQHD
jgi:hypothetical protein